jgi:hypothetical protein
VDHDQESEDVMATMEQVVEVYIKLRDEIDKREDAHKEELKPLKARLDGLGSALLGHLTSTGVDNVSIKGVGTVLKQRVISCSVGDKEGFWNWLEESPERRLEFLNISANKTAVTKMADSTGELPPGVKYSVSVEAQVRRARGT